MDEWFYKQADAEFGPISEAELQALLEQEKNAAEIQVRRNPSEAWVSAAAARSVNQRPLSVPPPLPSQSRPTLPVTTLTGPTGWLWISAMLLALDLLVLGFIQFVFSAYHLFLLVGITGLPAWFTQCVNALDSRAIWPQAAMILLLILWQGCAFGSVLRLYAGSRIEHGRGSGFWWITPVANLFMPFHCLRELRWASRQKRTAPESGIPAGVVIWMIQALIILKVFATIADKLIKVASTASAGIAEESTSTLATVVNLAINFFGLSLGALLTVFVLRNLIHQIRLYRGWNTPAAAL